MGKSFFKNNYKFVDSAILNSQTYNQFLYIFQQIALARFEWVNLPKSMDERALEQALYFKGQAALLFDDNFGFINTNCSSNGNINIYGLPNKLHCYSYDYQTNRNLYTGFISDELNKKSAILVLNNWNRTPTMGAMELYAYRMYNAERTSDININSQKFPLLLLGDQKQKLTLENIYSQYEGNRPVILGDKTLTQDNPITCIKTDAPFITDKLQTYKKQIFNEALTYLGINNIIEEKKERLITDEADSNNELINMHLQSFLIPRQKACEQFNELFKLTNNKKIFVRVRSDLHNKIKNLASSITELEGEENGNLHNGIKKSN